MTLNEVLRNTNYDVALFSEEARKYIEDAIVVKTVRGKEMAHITCLKRGKEIVLKPEEAVRQLYLYKLIHEYGYPVSRIEVEFPIHFGREVKRADIAIMDKDRPMVPYIIVELKKPKLTDGKEQLKSYCSRWYYADCSEAAPRRISSAGTVSDVPGQHEKGYGCFSAILFPNLFSDQ